jgi:hypothetical protein
VQIVLGVGFLHFLHPFTAMLQIVDWDYIGLRQVSLVG